MPLVVAGGLIEQRFPQGVPMSRPADVREDVAEVIQLVNDAATRAGLADLVPLLLDRSTKPYVVNEAATRNDEMYIFSYPYRYPVLDARIGRAVTTELASERKTELIELSSALLYADRAAPAYSLLSRLRGIAPDCEVQLNLAQTVALGFGPRAEDVDREFLEATRACPGDPTPFAEWSRAVFARETRGQGEMRRWKLGGLGQEDHAVAIARQAQQTAPSYPAGYLAEAGVLLEVADKYARAGYRPFTARSMFRRALQLLDAGAAALPMDPSIGFGRARALAGLGRHDEAVSMGQNLLRDLTNDEERSYAAAIVQQEMMSAGRVVEAADLSELADTRRGDVDRCRSLSVVGMSAGEIGSAAGTMGAPEPGWPGTCRTLLIDATGGGYAGGADAVDAMDYIPKYRYAEIPADELQIYAGRPAADEPGEEISRALRGEWAAIGRDKSGLAVRVNDQLRRLGRLDQAADVMERALEQMADTEPRGLALDRLGETQYLLGDFRKAAASFEEARKAFDQHPPQESDALTPLDSAGAEWAAIKHAAARYRAGEGQAALPALDSLVIGPLNGPEWMVLEPVFLEVARSTLSGTIRLRAADYSAAADDLQRARQTCAAWGDGKEITPCALGVQDNNLAIALLRAGRPREAQQHARAAIAVDPANPLFTEGLANTLEEAGDLPAAERAYRDAIALDPTQTTAYNNLGVMLAERGDRTGAIELLRLAVGANPRYSAAWFNLGVALGAEDDLAGFVSSQGAYGMAIRQDTSLRSHAHTWISDRNVYDPGVDLSKPLPAEWSAGASRRPIWASVGPLGLMVAALLLLVQAGAKEWSSGYVAEHLLKSPIVDGRSPVLLGEVPAVLISTAAVTWLLGDEAGADGVAAWLAAGLGGVLLTASYVGSRRFAGLSAPRHFASWWGTTVGALAPLLTLGFLPVPALRRQGDHPWDGWWRGQATISAVAGVAMVASLWSGVPLVRGLAFAAVVMVGSSLIPIRPYDGVSLSRQASLIVGILLFVFGVLFEADWI